MREQHPRGGFNRATLEFWIGQAMAIDHVRFPSSEFLKCLIRTYRRDTPDRRIPRQRYLCAIGWYVDFGPESKFMP